MGNFPAMQKIDKDHVIYVGMMVTVSLNVSCSACKNWLRRDIQKLMIQDNNGIYLNYYVIII